MKAFLRRLLPKASVLTRQLSGCVFTSDACAPLCAAGGNTSLCCAGETELWVCLGWLGALFVLFVGGFIFLICSTKTLVCICIKTNRTDIGCISGLLLTFGSL